MSLEVVVMQRVLQVTDNSGLQWSRIVVMYKEAEFL